MTKSRTKSSLLVCLLAWTLLPGCSKSGTKQGSTVEASSNDSLWALAPANATVGLVAAGGTGKILLATWAELETSAAALPAGGQFAQQALAQARATLPPQVLDTAAHDEMGLDLDRGSALFVTGDEQLVAILPVADRKAFLASVGGTSESKDGDTVDRMPDSSICKEVSGHYVCAKHEALLATVGTNDAMAKHVAGRNKDLRGHIEVVVLADQLASMASDLSEMVQDVKSLDAALMLERGAFTLRAHLAASPKNPVVGAFATAPDTLAQEVAAQQPSGIWRIRVPLDQLVPAQEALPALAPVAAMGNIDAKADVLDNLTGELLVYALPGQDLRLVFEIGAKDGKRLQPLVAALCSLGQKNAPMLSIEMQDEQCTATVEPATLAAFLPEAQLPGAVELTLYTKKTAVGARMSMADTGATSAAEPSPVGRDLMTQPWNWAMWGHGNAAGMLDEKVLATFDDLPKEATSAMWLMSHLNEFGMGVGMREDGAHALVRVGTQWANPDKVLRKYQALLTRLLGGDASALDELEAAAKASPDTALGRSYKIGSGGMLAAVSSVGIIAAIAIPAFMKYISKSKTAEASMMVRRMYDGVRAYAMDPPVDGQAAQGSGLPSPSVGPTPPLGTCCAQGGKCTPEASYWQHPTWVALQFSVDDPHYYSYQYEVDDKAKEFVVRAIGDLDCDGEYATFEMQGALGPDGVSSPAGVRTVNELE